MGGITTMDINQIRGWSHQLDQMIDGYLEFSELSDEAQTCAAIICYNIAEKAVAVGDYTMPLLKGKWREMVIDMTREIEKHEKTN